MTVDFHHSQNKHDKATKVSFLERRLKCVRLQRKINEQEDKLKRQFSQTGKYILKTHKTTETEAGDVVVVVVVVVYLLTNMRYATIKIDRFFL